MSGRLVLAVLAIIATVGYTAASVSNDTDGFGPVPAKCMKCICIVESQCRMPNPVCHMDVGSLSCGPYQIKQGYWDDARLKGGNLDGSWRACTATFGCSERAVQGYMMRYATAGRLHHTPTCEDFARIHNGGPNGYKNPKTLVYWGRVKICLLR